MQEWCAPATSFDSSKFVWDSGIVTGFKGRAGASRFPAAFAALLVVLPVTGKADAETAGALGSGGCCGGGCEVRCCCCSRALAGEGLAAAAAGGRAEPRWLPDCCAAGVGAAAATPADMQGFAEAYTARADLDPCSQSQPIKATTQLLALTATAGLHAAQEPRMSWLVT